MSYTSETVKRLAMEKYVKEAAAAWAAEEKARRDAASAAAAIQEAERLARIRAEQEREEARIRAERTLAEEKIRAEKAALDAAVEAELTRLRNRTELEVLRDEVAELKGSLGPVPSGLVDSLRSEICDLRKQLEVQKTLTSGMLTLHTPPPCPSPRCLQLVANNTVLGIDPAYGHGKTLQVSYSIDGQRLTKTCVPEHKELMITGQNIEIWEATWSCTGRGSADVTSRVKSLIRPL